MIAASPATGVIDDRHQLFGYENLLVCDGAAIPSNIGVNPSLTITAMAERAIRYVPPSVWADPVSATPVTSLIKVR